MRLSSYWSVSLLRVCLPNCLAQLRGGQSAWESGSLCVNLVKRRATGSDGPIFTITGVGGGECVVSQSVVAA